MLLTIVGYVLAVGIGLSLGLIGGGGSILAVPILIYVMGVESREAIAMSLFIVGCVSLLGAMTAAKQGKLSWRIVAGFTPTAMVGAYLGSQLVKLPLVSDTVQLISFGAIMLVASVLMIQKSRAMPNQTSSAHPHSFLQRWARLAILIEGFAVGIVTGFVGVGGGFLIIPALVLLSRVPMRTAVGTSLLIISLNSAVGFAGYLNQVSLNWPLTLSFTFAAAIGTVIGSFLAKHIEPSQLQKGFGYFVLAVAIFVLIKR